MSLAVSLLPALKHSLIHWVYQVPCGKAGSGLRSRPPHRNRIEAWKHSQLRQPQAFLFARWMRALILSLRALVTWNRIAFSMPHRWRRMVSAARAMAGSPLCCVRWIQRFQSAATCSRDRPCHSDRASSLSFRLAGLLRHRLQQLEALRARVAPVRLALPALQPPIAGAGQRAGAGLLALRFLLRPPRLVHPPADGLGHMEVSMCQAG